MHLNKMNSEVENYIRENCHWNKIPQNIRQMWIINQKEYEKLTVEFSIKNQLRHRGNLVRHIKKDEKQYYEELVAYSSRQLMLYPYHLSDVVVPGLRITPFNYYIGVMESIMLQERSYDSLPNFTAADCVRLLGIGRNEYIDLMNQSRSGRKLFRRRNVKEQLPTTPPSSMHIEPWWLLCLGMVTEDDIKHVGPDEKLLIDRIIDHGPQKTGDCNRDLVKKLYNKGLIYLDVPVDDNDHIIVPPLEGFVMNRVLGDYFETLLYKIFVSIDEHTSVAELSSVLQIDLESVKNAVSLYCRLGFAKKKFVDDSELHPSWNRSPSLKRQDSIISVADPLLLELDEALAEAGLTDSTNTNAHTGLDDGEPGLFSSPGRSKRVAFLFDSTLTAFLMMGNLSPGLKNHAVTMFEVGKLPDESLDSLLAELEKISTDDSEGEAQRYFEHALVLRSTVKFLRQLPVAAAGLDLVRCESLQSLDTATCSRLLTKNYTLLVSMAPLSKEIRPITTQNEATFPGHLGPAIPELNTLWFKLFLYAVSGYGPTTLLLSKGTRLKRLPKALQQYKSVLLMTTWGHDAAPLPVAHAVIAINEALQHAAVLVQCYGEIKRVAFPLNGTASGWEGHAALKALGSQIDLEHNCGFLTMVRCNDTCNSMLAHEIDKITTHSEDNLLTPSNPVDQWTLLDCDFGIPLFNAETNEEVCKNLTDCKLWEASSLKNLSESDKKLAARFLEFVYTAQEQPDQLNDIFKIPQPIGNRQPSGLLPRHSWIFENGSIRLWDGR